ncbi:MAG: DUF4019 domain-containing protein [Parachlamydia sp.]|nr:DUF4019 domain-containing protein [Parachlamydia sp.]
MSMKFFVLPLMSLLLTLASHAGAQEPAVMAPPSPQAQGLTPEEQKILADNAADALRWLQLVDQGKYGESWDAASKTFQLTIGRNEWIKAEEKLRKPLGAVVARQLLQQLPKQNPKGLPEGYYMVLVYQTDFAGRPKANELVTMVLESDGRWRVLTYQAR